MLIIENNLIPFKGFLAMNFMGIFCFVRKDAWRRQSEESKKITLNHEKIHTRQMIETGFIFFFIIYTLEWLVRLFINGSKAYDNLSFEKEAYQNQRDFHYLENRKPYAMWRKKNK